ncbi:MAG: hypothetical protein M1826_002343 [Phylliscum demangeonii]|nr:MAG: hypothetical protein M1826_002343 [Phylliscum demangeonii]
MAPKPGPHKSTPPPARRVRQLQGLRPEAAPEVERADAGLNPRPRRMIRQYQEQRFAMRAILPGLSSRFIVRRGGGHLGVDGGKHLLAHRGHQVDAAPAADVVARNELEALLLEQLHQVRQVNRDPAPCQAHPPLLRFWSTDVVNDDSQLVQHPATQLMRPERPSLLLENGVA